jgi:hypothetical protein
MILETHGHNALFRPFVHPYLTRQAGEKAGGKIVILPLVPGKSTTALLQKISRL